MAELHLPPDQAQGALTSFLAEFERRLPSFVTIVALTSLLPLLGERAQKRLRAADETSQNAEDLGQEVVARILDACYGRWPRGNAGAWVATIVSRAVADHFRRPR